MRARGCLLGLLGVVVGLALVGSLVDAGARHYATSRIEKRIGVVAPQSRGVKARIHSWPFLQIAANGHIDEVGAHIAQLADKPLRFSDLDVDVRGVQIDQGRLASEGKIVITHIDSGRITLAVTAADFSAAIGLPVSLGDAVIGAAAGRIKVTVAAATRQLVIDVVGVHRFALQLPAASVLPCVPIVTLAPDRLTLSCPISRVPDALTALAS
ncbi:MAG: hypothetical protein NVS3B21_15910 [Acidimicrobiales bacterium]